MVETQQKPLGNAPLALVTGATGAVGPVVVKRLLDARYRVHALVRRDVLPGFFRDEVICVRGDINDRNALLEAVAGADVVFHLAAKLHINQPDPSLRDEYRRVNIEGTRTVAEAAAAAGVKRFVHFSTINVYGSSEPPEILDETSPPHCDSWYAETKWESERIVLGLLPATVLRLAAVYGPGMKGNYTRLLDALRRHRYVPIGDGRNRRTLVHQADVAEAAVLVASRPEAVGQIYNVSDGEIHTIDQIVTAMCHALNRSVPRVRIPVVCAKAAAGVVDVGLRCFHRRPMAMAAVNKLLEDMAVSAAKIQSELGFHPKVDLERGWNTIVGQ